MIAHVDRLDDPRISDYARVGDGAWLRDHGLFVAEGRLIVMRLLQAAPAAMPLSEFAQSLHPRLIVMVGSDRAGLLPRETRAEASPKGLDYEGWTRGLGCEDYGR